MNIHDILFALTLVTLAGCKSTDGHEDQDDALLEQRCEELCLKPLCNPTLDPVPGIEQECSMRCSDTVDRAREPMCRAEYEALLDCLEPLSCGDFYRWLQSEANGPCVADEERLTEQCPEVVIRQSSRSSK